MSGEKYSIVMLRHGNSIWTENNLFCGWYDSNLSERGIFRLINYQLSKLEFLSLFLLLFVHGVKDFKKQRKQGRHLMNLIINLIWHTPQN